MRAGALRQQDAVVVNVTDVEPVEKSETVHWVDPIHRRP